MFVEEPMAEGATEQVPIALDEAAFATAYALVLESELKDRPSVRAVLRNRGYALAGHRFVLTVTNAHEQALMEQMREVLVQSLRAATANPTLVMELKLDEAAQAASAAPMETDEERLKRLEETYPALRYLQAKFGTTLSY